MRPRWHRPEGQRWPSLLELCCGDKGLPARSRAKQPNGSAPSQEHLPCSRTVPSPPWCQPLTAPHCWAQPGMAPRTSSSRVLAAEQAGEGLPQQPGYCLSPQGHKCSSFGREEEAAAQSLQLSACSGHEVVPGGCEQRCWHGVGPPWQVQRDSAGCAQPPALQWPFRGVSSALWTIKIMQQLAPEKCWWGPSSALPTALGNRMWGPSDLLL